MECHGYSRSYFSTGTFVFVDFWITTKARMPNGKNRLVFGGKHLHIDNVSDINILWQCIVNERSAAIAYNNDGHAKLTLLGVELKSSMRIEQRLALCCRK